MTACTVTDSKGHAILTRQLLEFYFYSRPYCFPYARYKHNKPFPRKYHNVKHTE
jgi:hypothetical protein